MASSSEPTDLRSVSRALDDNPRFLAGWLSAAPGEGRSVGDRLGLDEASLQRLLLCRAPRPNRYRTDVTAIAEYIDVHPTAVASVLREAGVLATLRQGGTTVTQDQGPVRAHDTQPGPAGLLAAARDTAAEQLPSAPAPSGLRELAAATWMAAPLDVRERRDVQSALVWASPVMVVSLPRLHLATANRWLADHGVPPLADAAGRLHGLLVAWRGQAAIFVDGTLPETERRLTLAHEHGHLLVDYLLPRQRVRREAPELLDVIDGRRAPDDADRARAALARVPLGLHTHLLHRDDGGGATETTLRAEEAASVYALELLAPWDEMLSVLRGELPASGPYTESLRSAADVVARTFALPADAARVRATGALAAMGFRPGFFDR